MYIYIYIIILSNFSYIYTYIHKYFNINFVYFSVTSYHCVHLSKACFIYTCSKKMYDPTCQNIYAPII